MEAAERANRLIHETSPYLLQHAHNPVDWYPWGPEAFAAARAANKPIFLSVGYSTCYWCHVMERQSFENPAIAQQMNDHFINIKVDREERPDVDQLYMSAVQAMSGHGGWPMSVFLTPDLRPFFGGTYFPPSAVHGRIGFPQLLTAIDDAWKNRRDEVDGSANRLLAILRQMAHPPQSRSNVRIDQDFLNELVDRSTADYDPTDGGFGSAPKFPRQTLLELLLISQRHSPNPRRLSELLHTLDSMARGGIHDHLGGAFHRYSTDDRWLVPHFEIMLYDNAMLAWIYTEAFAQTQQLSYVHIAGGILDFVLREMTSPEGAFYTAFDAEVDAQEGLTYLWTATEIEEVLGTDAAAFEHAYGVDEGPNFSDPHHGSGTPDKNILFLREPLDEATERKLAPMRQALYAHRRKRKQPLLDTKILTSWNALMIRAMAHTGQSRYITAAQKATEYLLKTHQAADGSLYRVSRDGVAKGAAFLDDYAFLAQALLELHAATGQAKWHEQADILAGKMCGKFVDPRQGGFFFTAADASDLIVRQKTASDSPLPSGNAIAADVMLQLGHPSIARDAIAIFAGQLHRFGEGMSALAQAALQYVLQHGPISVETQSPAPATQEVLTMSAQWVAPNQLDLTVSIANGFHINAHQAGTGLVPTVLSVAGEAADQLAAIDYPLAQMRAFDFADEPIPVYQGRLNIAVRFGAPVTDLPLTLHLRYQPCNENSCLAPATQTLVVNSSLKGRA